MTISNIGATALSIHISEEELQSKNLNLATIGQVEALLLFNFALKEKRLEDWEFSEIELFPGRDSLLLFARRKSGTPKHFLFDDFETLLTASKLCETSLPSTLSRTETGYLLSIYPFEGDRAPAIFYEFANEVQGAAHLSDHFAEQGRVLIAKNALQMLQTHFA